MFQFNPFYILLTTEQIGWSRLRTISHKMDAENINWEGFLETRMDSERETINN